MDTQTQTRLDAVLEDEVHAGFRLKAVPEALQRQMRSEGLPAIERVRFTRVNPGKRRKIAEVVQRQYHRDLQNPDILSHEQILKLVQERGEWTPAMEAELKELQSRVNREMTTLFLDGTAEEKWGTELLAAAAAFRRRAEALVAPDDLAAVMGRFDRWLEYSPELQESYNELYAVEQGRDRYSPDTDLQRLLHAVPDPEAVAQLNTLDDLRDRLQRYLAFQRARIRLAELQVRQGKIFADSVEQRRDTTDELARVYFTTERVDETGHPQGPLTPTFEGLWDWPESLVQWFMVEAYFFQNGIPDEARAYLQTFGFLEADETPTSPSEPGESGPSGESLAPPTSRPATALAEGTVSDSSAAPVATSSTTGS